MTTEEQRISAMIDQRIRETADPTTAAALGVPPLKANGEVPDLLRFHRNDHGNACRLIALYGEDLHYCHAFKKWLVWDRTRWAVDDTDQACRLAKQTILEFLRQATQTG